MRLNIALAVLPVAFLGVSCSQKSDPTPQAAAPAFHQVTGKITELHPADKSVEIKHDEIPGYMGAMTMPFDVKDTNVLTGLAPGDSVSFKLNVTSNDAWIENIRVVERAATPATNGAVIRVRDVEPLSIGDRLPEYHFTNEFGAPISTTQFKGKALAITFLFTRCPLPTFCPLMARNFAATQRGLSEFPDAPTNWHLLAVTIDPDYDTPAVLRDYGDRMGCRTNSMSFLTGDKEDIAAFADQLGLAYSTEPGSLPTHNLRTVVVDASGKIQNIIAANKWTADELAQELVKAASVKP